MSSKRFVVFDPNDPFDYRPMVKVAKTELVASKSRSQLTPTTSTPKSKSKLDLKSQTKSSTLTIPTLIAKMSEAVANNRRAERRRCPHCHIPLELLDPVDVFGHKSLCGELSHSRLQLCDEGFDCLIKDPTHYYKYRHVERQEESVNRSSIVVRSMGREEKSAVPTDSEDEDLFDDDDFNKESNEQSLSGHIVRRPVVDDHQGSLDQQGNRPLDEEKDGQNQEGEKEGSEEDEEWEDDQQINQQDDGVNKVKRDSTASSKKKRHVISDDDSDQDENDDSDDDDSSSLVTNDSSPTNKDNCVGLEAVGDSDSLHLNFDFPASQGVRLKTLNVKIAPKHVFSKPIVARGQIIHEAPTTRRKTTPPTPMMTTTDHTKTKMTTTDHTKTKMTTTDHTKTKMTTTDHTKTMRTTSKMSREEAGRQFNSIFAKAKKQSEPKKSSIDKSPDGAIKHPSESFQKRVCPFYKKIPNTRFVVDAFNYGVIEGVSTYFLSHFHYDHFVGLTKDFKSIIVCSQITARLLALRIKVLPSLLRPFPLNETVVIDNVQVTLLEANHCPGAVMFLFKCTSGQVFLHCGDFRYTPVMSRCKILNSVSVDRVYLDTTYCKRAYDFPDQEAVIRRAEQLVSNFMENRKDNCLVLCGSYTIGKERLFISIAEALETLAYAHKKDKRVILSTLKWDRLARVMTEKKDLAILHVVEMFVARNENLAFEYVKKIHMSRTIDTILTVIPTGWTHTKGCSSEQSLKSMSIRRCGKRTHNFHMLEVPYSEHSSFSELKAFVKLLRLQRSDQIVPTVNVRDAQNMRSIFDEWINNGNGQGRTERRMQEFFSHIS